MSALIQVKIFLFELLNLLILELKEDDMLEYMYCLHLNYQININNEFPLKKSKINSKQKKFSWRR